MTITQPQVTEAQYDEFLDHRDWYWNQEGYWTSERRTDARAPMVEVIDAYTGKMKNEWASYRFVFREDAKPEIYKRKTNPS